MGTPYKVGDLEVSIKSISTDALTSLDTVITKMSSLSAVLRSVTSTDLKWITGFGTRMKTLSKNMQTIDWGSVEGGFNRLAVAITPFLDKVNKATVSLQSLNSIMTKASGNKFMRSQGSISNGGRTSLSFVSSLLPSIFIAKRLANSMADLVQYGVDYTETLNLWQVAMRENLSLATEFVNKMNKAYGISQKTLMSAQATFRNMIGSLGDLSDETSYALSEAITQMAVDYASLYNTTIETAVNKFQSALAGQVRPIRSISGYDITEKTIQALYESIGGTKTQRQLSRTEKQLLAIYAVFNQMERSGALGDMTKTLDNFANQSRMMVENFKELATWAGTILTYLLQENGVMVKINAGLIYATALVKEIAYSLGYETPDFGAGWSDNIDDASKSVDELKGKLLGFDKIRALQTGDDELSIDQKLLEAMSGYSSLITEANNKAQTLADTWKEATFWQDGIFDKDKFDEYAKDIKDAVRVLGLLLVALRVNNFSALAFGNTLKNVFSLKTLGISLLVVSFMELYATSEEFRDSINNLWKDLKPALTGIITGGGKILSVVTPLITAVVDILDNLGLLQFTIYAILGLSIANKIINLTTAVNGLLPLIGALGLKLTGLSYIVEYLLNRTSMLVLGIGALAGGILLFVTNFDNLSDKAKVWIPVLSALAGVVASVAVALAGMSFKAIVTAGSIVAGIGMVVGTLASIEEYANGGTPDKGTLFIAGEAGAEIVSTSSNGQTGVSNVRQIEQAFYNALVRYGGGSTDGNAVIVVKVGEDEVFRATRKGALKQGLDFAREG